MLPCLLMRSKPAVRSKQHYYNNLLFRQQIASRIDIAIHTEKIFLNQELYVYLTTH